MLDHVYLHVEVPFVEYRKSSATIYEHVIGARRIQAARFRNKGPLNFSVRTHDRILKVARTLANLADSESMRPDDILENHTTALTRPRSLFLIQYHASHPTNFRRY